MTSARTIRASLGPLLGTLALLGCHASDASGQVTSLSAIAQKYGFSEGLVEGQLAVRGEVPEAPEGCDARSVANRLAAFLEAIGSDGEVIQAEFFPSPESRVFEFFAVGGGGLGHFVANEVGELGEYFRSRHAESDHMELIGITVNRWDDGRGLVHFGPVLVTRSANDLSPGIHPVVGKGALHCESQTIGALSLNTDPELRLGAGE